MSYFSMIFSQCAPGRLYSAAIWHAGFFFFRLHIRASKTSSTASGTKTINNHSIFSFFLCYFIKKRQNHDVWLSNSKQFRNYFSSHGWVFDDHELSHLQPLCLTPGNGSKAALGSAFEKLAERSDWPSHSSDCRQLGGLSMALTPVCVPSLTLRHPFPPRFGYRWEWLADTPGTMQTTRVSIPAKQPGC